MPQSSDSVPFKFVAVEPEQDELVIHAGVGRAADQATQAPSADQRTGFGARVLVEGEGIPPKTAEPAEKLPLEGEDAPGKGAHGRAAVSGRSDDPYRETTLDDLAHEPMPKLQRGVLIGVGVLVVAFIAYVLLF